MKISYKSTKGMKKHLNYLKNTLKSKNNNSGHVRPVNRPISEPSKFPKIHKNRIFSEISIYYMWPVSGRNMHIWPEIHTSDPLNMFLIDYTCIYVILSNFWKNNFFQYFDLISTKKLEFSQKMLNFQFSITFD